MENQITAEVRVPGLHGSTSLPRKDRPTDRLQCIMGRGRTVM